MFSGFQGEYTFVESAEKEGMAKRLVLPTSSEDWVNGMAPAYGNPPPMPSAYGKQLPNLAAASIYSVIDGILA